MNQIHSALHITLIISERERELNKEFQLCEHSICARKYTRAITCFHSETTEYIYMLKCLKAHGNIIKKNI